MAATVKNRDDSGVFSGPLDDIELESKHTLSDFLLEPSVAAFAPVRRAGSPPLPVRNPHSSLRTKFRSSTASEPPSKSDEMTWMDSLRMKPLRDVFAAAPDRPLSGTTSVGLTATGNQSVLESETVEPETKTVIPETKTVKSKDEIERLDLTKSIAVPHSKFSSTSDERQDGEWPKDWRSRLVIEEALRETGLLSKRYSTTSITKRFSNILPGRKDKGKLGEADKTIVWLAAQLSDARLAKEELLREQTALTETLIYYITTVDMMSQALELPTAATPKHRKRGITMAHDYKDASRLFAQRTFSATTCDRFWTAASELGNLLLEGRNKYLTKVFHAQASGDGEDRVFAMLKEGARFSFRRDVVEQDSKLGGSSNRM